MRDSQWSKEYSTAMKQYRKISVPLDFDKKFNRVAKDLGYKKPGQRWMLLTRLLDDASSRFDEEYNIKNTPEHILKGLLF